MKGNSRIIEIDGEMYAVDCTFDSSPAIYRTMSIKSPFHIGSPRDEYPITDYDSPVPPECVVILATPVGAVS